MPDITWTTKAWGRESDIIRLNNGRNNENLGPKTRKGHDRAHGKIQRQLRDRKYLHMRENLIQASRAGDLAEVEKLELRIRDHLNEPREAFTSPED